MKRICWGVLLLGFMSESVWASESEVAEFRANYPEAVRRLNEHSKRLSGWCRVETTSFRTKRSTISRGDFIADGGYCKVTFKHPDDKGKGSRTVLCVGPGMAYRLFSAESERKGPPTVVGIGESVLDEAAFRQKFGRFLMGSHSMGGVGLQVFASGPEFEVLSAERAAEKGRALRRIEFRSGAGGLASARGWMRLDPALGWALVDWELETTMPKGTIKKSGSVEYGSPIDGLPVPKLIRVNESNGDKTTCEFFDLTRAPVPATEFMMSSYGLPNLAGPKPWDFGRLAAPTLTAVGVGLFLVARRRHGRTRGIGTESI